MIFFFSFFEGGSLFSIIFSSFLPITEEDKIRKKYYSSTSLFSSKFSFSSCQKRTKNKKYSSSTSMGGEFFIFIKISLFFLSEKKKKKYSSTISLRGGSFFSSKFSFYSIKKKIFYFFELGLFIFIEIFFSFLSKEQEIKIILILLL